ncbi:MAG: hypothetical protein ACLQCB_10440 [Spirochaetia bacterium]
MIKLSLKGFADFMSAGPAKQRTILWQYKHPDEDEARAKIVYYREARDRIAAYHKHGEEPGWLDAQANGIATLAAGNSGQTRVRLGHNARALTQYRQHFAHREYEVLGDLTLHYTVDDVTITVAPDLHVREKGAEKIIKFEFGKNAPSDRLVKILSQVMFQAAEDSGLGLPSSSVLYVDVPRNKIHKGARTGARMARDLEATCQMISAVWQSI